VTRSGARARRAIRAERAGPLCIAHRGASARAPENTLAAFDAALRDGATVLEFDVRLTRDDAPVVLHDATLDRTTDGRGPVAAVSLSDLRRLDAGGWFGPRFRGERVPTLDETLAFAHGRCGVNIELKTEPDRRARRGAGRADEAGRLALAVARSIRRARFPGLLVISSFSRPALAAARAAMPRVRLGLLASRSARGLRAAHAGLRLWSFHPHQRLVGPRRIALARRLGLRILVWPVNDPRAFRRLAALAIDGVMTDDPALMRAVSGPPAVPEKSPT
jgi:glycerophosphoryl diester phosphodiesterase